MSIVRCVVWLYPAPVRQRWGVELEQQVLESGPRCWPNVVAGAAGLWLHPALWPETAAGQKRHSLATAAFAIAAATALLMRNAGTPAFGTGPDDVAGSTWLLLVLVGVLAASPLPQMRSAAFARLIVLSARTLSPPAIALLAMFMAAHTGLVTHPTGLLKATLVTAYWSILAFAGMRGCALVAATRDIATAPSIRRLRVAMALLGSGLALAAAQLLSTMARTRADTSGAITSIALIGLVVVLAGMARDLRTARC